MTLSFVNAYTAGRFMDAARIVIECGGTDKINTSHLQQAFICMLDNCAFESIQEYYGNSLVASELFVNIPYTFEHLFLTNNLPAIKWLYAYIMKNTYKSNQIRANLCELDNLYCIACENNNVQMLDWLRDTLGLSYSKHIVTPDLFVKMCIAGKLDIAKWLYMKSPCIIRNYGEAIYESLVASIIDSTENTNAASTLDWLRTVVYKDIIT